MINFVGGSPSKALQLMTENGAPECTGSMTSPRAANHPRNAIALGLPWVLDNDCYFAYKPPLIVRMLTKFYGLPGCTFAAVPDVVADHAATLERWHLWSPIYKEMEYPRAFVLQDGVTLEEIPFDDCEAIFVGGSTPFKYLPIVREAISLANSRGLWTHMGRVNMPERILYAKSIGCKSTDGSGFLRFREKFAYAPLFKES